MKRAALSVVALLAALTLAGCGYCPADCDLAVMPANAFGGAAVSPAAFNDPLSTYWR